MKLISLALPRTYSAAIRVAGARLASCRQFAADGIALKLLALALVALAGAAAWSAESGTKSKTSAKTKKNPLAVKTDVQGSLGGPTNDAPDHVLALWSNGPAVAWRAEGWALTKRADRALADIEQAGDDALKGKLIEIGRVRVLLLRLDHIVEALTLWSEPAANDLNVRGRALHIRCDLRAAAAFARPDCLAIIHDHLKVFEEKVGQGLEVLKKLRARTEHGGSAKELYSRVANLYEELSVESTWYRRQLLGYLHEFEVVLAPLRRQWLAEQARIANAALEPIRAAPQAGAADVLKTVGEVLAALGAGQPVRVDNREVDGPQALSWFLDRWQQVHLQALRRWAVDCPIVVGNEASEPRVLDRAAAVEFQTKLAAPLVPLIQADAAHVELADVRRRYLAYVEILAPVLAACSPQSGGNVEPWQGALDALAAKDPALAAEVSAYRQATSRLLVWRKRLAVAQSITAKQQHPPVPNDVFKELFVGAVPTMMRSLADKLVGQELVGSNFLAAPPGGSVTSDRDVQRRYFVLPRDSRLDAEAAALGEELLIVTGAAPLTLEAAIAVAGAERGNLSEAGGIVERIEVDAVTTLYAKADAHLGGLARINEFSDVKVACDLWLRVELSPRWYHTPFAFIELPTGNR